VLRATESEQWLPGSSSSQPNLCRLSQADLRSPGGTVRSLISALAKSFLAQRAVEEVDFRKMHRPGDTGKQFIAVGRNGRDGCQSAEKIDI
jgi:hypothetical protein